MAKVKLAFHLDAIAGKAGANNVYQRFPGGTVLRNRVIPLNPNSPSQVATRALMTQLSQAWGTALNDAEREAWNTAAASTEWTQTNDLGDQFQLSGEQLFLKLNMVILGLGGSQVNAVPAKATIPALSVTSVNVEEGTPDLFELAYTGTLSANDRLIVETSPAVSAGRMSIKSVRLAKIADLDSADTSPVTLSTDYTTKWGAVSAGEKVWTRVYWASVLTGEKSLITEVATEVA